LLLSGQMLFQATASARASEQDDAPMRQSRFESSTPEVAAPAAQGASVQKGSSAGRQFLRNTLIGAAIGAAVLGSWQTGDCGECGSDRTKAILSGAMYGALFGAAIRIHPSRRPSTTHSRQQATIGPQLTKTVKAVNVTVRF
jgi:hypothetical protein